MSTTVAAGRRIDRAFSAKAVIDGREYLGFAGFGYLALTDLPEIRAAVADALARGVAFSRVMPGAAHALDKEFDDVERVGARALNAERSLYFATGYMIGMVGLAALDPSTDLLLLDEHAYTNLKDAATLSGLPVVPFAHCDSNALAEAIRTHLKPGQRPLVITDGVFGPTGRMPPLRDYASVLSPYDGRMLIDESHSFGTVGENGRGAAELCDVESIATIGATLSKAYCAHGALLACSAETAEKLRNAPVIRASSAGSPLSAAASGAALAYVETRPEIRRSIRAMADHLRTRLRTAGFEVTPGASAIVSFTHGNAGDMQNIRLKLAAQGILIVYGAGYASTPPEGILRCSVFRDHGMADMDRLADAIASA